MVSREENSSFSGLNHLPQFLSLAVLEFGCCPNILALLPQLSTLRVISSKPERSAWNSISLLSGLSFLIALIECHSRSAVSVIPGTV